jgi:DNA repair exonuclease SbcCD nuclease subunit
MGQFKAGEPRPEGAGRKPGSENKRSLAIREYCEKRGVSPAHFCIDVLAGDGDAVGKDIISFEDKQWAVETLMPYVEQKLKQVEHTGESVGDFFLKLAEKINAKPDA